MGQKQPAPKESPSDQMFDMVFEFKQIAKEFKRSSAQAAKEEKEAILRVKSAIEKNLPEAARIHASDAIRKKNETRQYLLLSSKIEAVHSRLSHAYKTQKVKSIFNLVN
jgi:charged multivesicular body protein 1